MIPAPSRTAVPFDTVRRLEADAMAALPAGTLMARAAAAIAVTAGHMLREMGERVSGSRVVLLVGSGDNGGDALYAGARLASRGARVDALLMAHRHHVEGASALARAGGRLHLVNAGSAVSSVDGYAVTELISAAELVAGADLVIDGILGIGGSGALREPAATLAAVARETEATVLAIDLPSGVDADTGAVADRDRVVVADRTVVLGTLKAGLLVGAGASCSGDLEVVDIGLDLASVEPHLAVTLIDDLTAAGDLARPGVDDDKYTRGVVGISTGSTLYAGAAVLSTGGARHGIAGYVRYRGPAYSHVVTAWPDVVATPGRLIDAGRVQCWVVGSGRGTDDDARDAVLDAAGLDLPLVLDADGLTLLATDADVRAAVMSRAALTVLTPHDREFARIAGGEPGSDRVSAARDLAVRLGVVVLLKGSTTVVAAPSGAAYLAVAGPAELATAGSGDVLSGLIGSLLARHEALGRLDPEGGARLAAVAAHVHGVAGQVAIQGGRTLAALDLVTALPDAIARVRRAGGV